ncbi:MAG: hypothetical protein JSV80_13325 [Acidobacteriota bacterium]|nr:MAG: hypothetical protein JSV80_13325 [Acidobacteriota bacterium]
MRERTQLLLIAAAALITSAPALAQSPFPISKLVLEGDTVTDVGLVTSISNVGVTNNGDWIVEADTDNPDTDRDSVVLRNGSLFAREGDPLPSPVGSSLNTFDGISMNVNLDVGWNLFLTGPPSNQDSGIYYNFDLVIQEGDTSIAPEFGAGTVYLGFFDAKLNDTNDMVTLASVDDPTIGGTLERALVKLDLGPAGALLGESAIVKEGDLLAGQTELVVELGTSTHQNDINELGQSLFFADLDGSTATDGVIYVDDRLIAQEGSPSPVAGRNYELLSSRAMNMNNVSQVVFKANLDGTTADDEMIVADGRELIREGQSLPAISGFQFTSFGSSSGPVAIDDYGNVLWYGDWNDPDTGLDTGLFLNDLLLVQEGVTLIDGLLVQGIGNIAETFAISDDGQYVIFEATLEGGLEGAFLIEVDAPKPVPDGDTVAGTQSTAVSNGVNIDVTWDAVTCPEDDYNLFYGPLEQVGDYAYTGAECGLGTSGQASFPAPANNAFWMIAGVDAASREGAHGFDSVGRARPAGAGGLCGVVTQLNTASCP